MIDENKEFEDVNSGVKNSLWMLSFADLISLILTFFVLFFSMSQLQNEEWKKMAKSISSHFNHESEIQLDTTEKKQVVSRLDVPFASNLGYLVTMLEDRLKEYPWRKDIHITDAGDRVFISLPGEMAFAPGGTALTPKSQEIIENLALIMSNLGNQIEVIGNSDPTPISTPQFPSNWELSISRAEIVADKIRSAGYVYTINSLGRGSSNYETQKTADNEKERYKIARRVDIVITNKSAAMISN